MAAVLMSWKEDGKRKAGASDTFKRICLWDLHASWNLRRLFRKCWLFAKWMLSVLKVPMDSSNCTEIERDGSLRRDLISQQSTFCLANIKSNLLIYLLACSGLVSFQRMQEADHV